jgi:predicted permease
VDNQNNFNLEATPTPPGEIQPVTPWVGVSPEYFRLLGLTLVQGRLLDARDLLDAPPVVVVDRAWARRFFPNGEAVGQRLREGGCTDCPWTTVVGVVTEVKYAGLDAPDQGAVYSPIAGRFRYLMLRTHPDPSSVLPAVRQAIRELDSTLPFSSVATVDDLVAQELRMPRSLSLLVGSFAIVALLLASVGIYGVMGYYVQQHSKEIGIRLALGGSPADVRRLVVGQGMSVVALGVVVGLLGALALTRLMSSLLFGVGALDGATFVGAALLLLSVALVGCGLPASRAAAVSPATALRNE